MSEWGATTEGEPQPSLAPPPPPPPREPPGAGRRYLGPRSLTARLVIGVVALVAVLVAAIGAGTYVELRSFLYDRLDQQLASAASENASFFERCVEQQTVLPRSRCTNSGPPPTQPEWVALLSADGTELLAVQDSAHFHRLRLSGARRVSFASDPAQRVTIDYQGTELRVTADRSGDLVIVTGLATIEVSRTLHRLVVLELLIGGAALLLALLATSYGVRFSLRRLRRVTSTAQEVAAELSPTGAGLDRRVLVTEQGTEVGQLAESMNTLLAAVETQFAARLASEQRMRQFLADASHELRTPLTSIRGFAELVRMQRGANGDGDGADADNIARIEAEGTRMSRLVEDLLMLARGDSDGSAPERVPVDVAELLDDAVSSSRAAFPDRPIDLDATLSDTLIGDHDQLLRVVRNLVANAALHTRPGAPIRVRGFADRPGVAVQIIDGGPGLPPEEAAHVFERFWRADKARSRARGGTGLGLSIVASIVAAHGGTVRFDSSVETGSTVTVWLPRFTPPAPRGD